MYISFVGGKVSPCTVAYQIIDSPGNVNTGKDGVHGACRERFRTATREAGTKRVCIPSPRVPEPARVRVGRCKLHWDA